MADGNARRAAAAAGANINTEHESPQELTGYSLATNPSDLLRPMFAMFR
jgi:hypothetical protein